jgi:hypothetical protein
MIRGQTRTHSRSETERRGRVFNTPASYWVSPGSKSQPRRTAILIEVFSGFPQTVQANSGNTALKFCHYPFLPNPFLFIIIHLYTIIDTISSSY